MSEQTTENATPAEQPVEGESAAAQQETTPRSFDEAYVKKLRDEAASYRVKLKEYEDRDKSELEKLTERAETAEAQLQKSELEKARLAAAAKHGIGEDHLDFLNGTTAEALDAQAEKLSKIIATPAAPQRVVIGGEQGEPAPLALNGDGIEDALKRALGI